MHRRFILTGIMFGAVAVALGAFGAHGLKKIVSVETVQVFQTGVQYQMYHALALIATGILYQQFSQKNVLNAARFFVIGISLFSGSLYLLTLGKASDLNLLDRVGMITPIGGVSFIVGWVLLFLGIYKGKNN